jgi:hypothetical protein
LSSIEAFIVLHVVFKKVHCISKGHFMVLHNTDAVCASIGVLLGKALSGGPCTKAIVKKVALCPPSSGPHQSMACTLVLKLELWIMVVV